MLRRILFALLILCLALPAAVPTAAQANASHPMAMMQDHTQPPTSTHDQSDHAAKHQCIGCAAALDRSPLPERRIAVQAVRVHPPLVAGLAEATAGPETPPPRI